MLSGARVPAAAWSAVLLFLVLGLAFLSVSVFPVITNDSVLYLQHSLDIARGGWVEYGYRQAGYPLVLSVGRWWGSVSGLEPLLSVAVLQRALLLLSAVLAWRFWKWWSLPVLALLVTAESLAFTNLLLTEGLALPLAALLVFPTIRFLELLRSEPRPELKRRAVALGLIVMVLALLLFSLRFTFAVFCVVPLILAMASLRTGFRWTAVSIAGVTVALAGLFTLALSLENGTEHGVFAPNVQGELVEYYYAWQQVFTLNPENRDDPALSAFFDEGFVHGFSREVAAMDLSHEEMVAVYTTEIETMLEAAGIHPLWSKPESMLFSLMGGRLHDTGGAVRAILASDGSDVYETIYMNQFADRRGVQEFADQYNNGQAAEALITNPVGWTAPFGSTRALVVISLPLAIILMVVGLRPVQTRAISMAGLAVVMTFSVGMGWIRADNFRFLLPTSAFGLMVGLGVLVQLVNSRLSLGVEDDSLSSATTSKSTR